MAGRSTAALRRSIWKVGRWKRVYPGSGIQRVGPEGKVLAEHQGAPVLVEFERHLAAAFRLELSEGGRVHELFLEIVDGAASVPSPGRRRQWHTLDEIPT